MRLHPGRRAGEACLWGKERTRRGEHTRMHATGGAQWRSLPVDATGAAARLQGSRPRHKHLMKDAISGNQRGNQGCRGPVLDTSTCQIRKDAKGAISEWQSYVIIKGNHWSSEVVITSFEHEDAREEMEQWQQPMRDGEQCRMT